MELDDLKKSWNTPLPHPKTATELEGMLRENSHPVLKRIRRQIIIETTGWFALLLCYYTMFDGAEKPLIANAVLVISVLAALLHNLAGYNFSRHLSSDGDIKTGIVAYLKKLKTHSAVTMLLRVIFIGGLLAFFIWNVPMDSRRYTLLAAALLIVAIQLLVLKNIWAKRIRALTNSLNSLE